ARFSTGTFAERASRMSLAVGAYSGPRAVHGAVAQLANNARHVAAAMRRIQIDVFECLGFMRFTGRLGLTAIIEAELKRELSQHFKRQQIPTESLPRSRCAFPKTF